MNIMDTFFWNISIYLDIIVFMLHWVYINTCLGMMCVYVRECECVSVYLIIIG